VLFVRKTSIYHHTIGIYLGSKLSQGLYNKSNEYFILSQDNVIIKKILVAVDGSKTSLDAVEHAICHAEKHNSELTALYIVSSDVRYGYLEDDQKVGLTGPLKEIVMMAVEKGEKLLDEVKQKASKTDIDVKTEVIIGYTSVAKSIVEYAEERNIDLIVIGTRGMTGIKKMLLGSTATGVVTYAHCPVLIVK
jgi:nucleotide-binding universal stress UspA family protein